MKAAMRRWPCAVSVLGRGGTHGTRRLAPLHTRSTSGCDRPLWSSAQLTSACVCSTSSVPPPTTAPVTPLQQAFSTLRAVGPCPLSKLSTSLPDEAAEFLAKQPGGFLSALQRASQAVVVVFVDAARKGTPRVPVAISQDSLLSVRREDKDIVMYLVGLLAVAKWTPRMGTLKDSEPLASDVLSAIQMSSLPAPTRLKLREGLTSLHSLVRRNPQLLALDVTGKRMRLTRPRQQSTGARHADRSRPPQGRPAAPSTPPVRTTPWRRFIAQCVPSSFFVPATFVVTHKSFAVASQFASDEPRRGAGECGDLAILHAAAQRGELQVVTLPPLNDTDTTLGTTYVRALWSGDLWLPEAASHQAAPWLAGAAEQVAEAAALDPLSLTQAVAEAVAASEHRDGNLGRLRLVKGLSADAMLEVLPAPLLARVAAFFDIEAAAGASHEATAHSAAAATPPPSPPQSPSPIGARAILLLDRMRHLFDVDLSGLRVRPWSVLRAEELPSSLTGQTSPLPLALMAALSQLQQSGPQSAAALVEAMPRPLLVRLLALYNMQLRVSNGWSGLEVHRTAVDDLLRTVPVSSQADVCATFLSQHPLYVTEKDGLFYTPELLARQRSGTGGHARPAAGEADAASQSAGGVVDVDALTDEELGQRLRNVLPTDGALIMAAATTLVVAHGFPQGVLTFDLVNRNPHLFAMYEPFLGASSVVGRPDVAGPPAALLQPRLDSLDDIVKYIAIKSCGGASENIIMQSLPPHARQLLKTRVGSITSLVEQLPEWFSVCRDVHNEGASAITYVGAAAAPAAPHPPLQPMRNVGTHTWRHEPLHPQGTQDGPNVGHSNSQS